MIAVSELGIPTLDPSWQATEVVLPAYQWGRGRKNIPPAGTAHFYVHDYRFSALWKFPDRVPDWGVTQAVEPNFSTWAGQPLAESIWATYRKRSLSRSWGRRGVKLFVDLNVGMTPAIEAINLAGVPPGWRAFATRAHRETGTAGLERDRRTAAEAAFPAEPLLLVYGGSARVREWAERVGAAWVPEHNDAIRGRPGGRSRAGPGGAPDGQGRRCGPELGTQGDPGVQPGCQGTGP